MNSTVGNEIEGDLKLSCIDWMPALLPWMSTEKCSEDILIAGGDDIELRDGTNAGLVRPAADQELIRRFNVFLGGGFY